MVYVLEMIRKAFHGTVLYKGTNLNTSAVSTSSNANSACKVYKVKNWYPILVEWLEWNIDSSNIIANLATTISYVSTDNIGRNQFAHRKNIGNYLILVTETMTIWEALGTIIQEKLSNKIIEND